MKPKILLASLLVLVFSAISAFAGPEKIRLEVNSGKMNTAAAIEFREMIQAELEERGISITDNTADPLLIVVVGDYNREWLATRVVKWAAELYIGGPWAHNTSNRLMVGVLLKEGDKVTDFAEFREFRESMRDWKAMRKALAARIADAVFYHH